MTNKSVSVMTFISVNKISVCLSVCYTLNKILFCLQRRMCSNKNSSVFATIFTRTCVDIAGSINVWSLASKLVLIFSFRFTCFISEKDTMKVTVTTLGDAIFTLEVSEDMELENFKALCEFESNIPAADIAILWNGRPLNDNKRKLQDYGIKDGEILLLQRVQRSSGPGSSMLTQSYF